jgi:hypothetical protein
MYYILDLSCMEWASYYGSQCAIQKLIRVLDCLFSIHLPIALDQLAAMTAQIYHTSFEWLAACSALLCMEGVLAYRDVKCNQVPFPSFASAASWSISWDYDQQICFYKKKNWNENHFIYSLRPILPFANMDVSSTKTCLDISVFAKGNMGRREY